MDKQQEGQDDLGRLFKRAAQAARNIGHEVVEAVSEALPDEGRQREAVQKAREVARKVEAEVADVVADARKALDSEQVEQTVKEIGGVFKDLSDRIVQMATGEEADDDGPDSGA